MKTMALVCVIFVRYRSLKCVMEYTGVCVAEFAFR